MLSAWLLGMALLFHDGCSAVACHAVTDAVYALMTMQPVSHDHIA